MMLSPETSFDFLSGAIDPRITYTRAGVGATRVNSSGYVEVVAADTPRFDYDPVTLACRGLLVEESRTNALLYSTQFSNGAWSTNRLVKVTGAASPDGGNNAVLMRPDTTSSAFHYVAQSVSSSGSTLLSFLVKAGGYNFLCITLSGANNAADRVVFDLSAGAVSSQAGNVTGSIEPWKDGWYWVSLATTLAVTTVFLHPLPTSAVGSFTGNGVSGVYAWAGQCEIGTFRTSLIATTSAPIVRNADVATITSAAFSGFWRSGPGSILVRALPSTVSGTRPLVQVDDATADNIIALRGNTTNPELYIRAGGSDQATIDAGTIAASTSYRLAGAWDTNNCAASLNGASTVLDTSATIPAVTQMRIGSDGTNYLNGHVESIEYYDQRLLDASMQVVSSPAGYQSIIGPVMRDTIIR